MLWQFKKSLERLAWGSEPERLRLTAPRALDKLVLHTQRHIITPWSPEGANNGMGHWDHVTMLGCPRLDLLWPRSVLLQCVELRGHGADGGARPGAGPVHPVHLGPGPRPRPRPEAGHHRAQSAGHWHPGQPEGGGLGALSHRDAGLHEGQG